MVYSFCWGGWNKTRFFCFPKGGETITAVRGWNGNIEACLPGEPIENDSPPCGRNDKLDRRHMLCSDIPFRRIRYVLGDGGTMYASVDKGFIGVVP